MAAPLLILSLAASVVRACQPLTTITPACGSPITVTEQHQPIATCSASTACIKGQCSTITPYMTYTYVSTVIPCAVEGPSASTTTVTNIDQPITVSKYTFTETRIIGPTQTAYTTHVKEWVAPYKAIGDIAIGLYGGSGLCKACEPNNAGIKTQYLNVTEHVIWDDMQRSFSYPEVWIQQPVKPVQEIVTAFCQSTVTVTAPGTYTYTFMQTAPPKTVILGDEVSVTTIVQPAQPYFAAVTKIYIAPTIVYIDATITTNIYYNYPVQTGRSEDWLPYQGGWNDWYTKPAPPAPVGWGNWYASSTFIPYTTTSAGQVITLTSTVGPTLSTSSGVIVTVSPTNSPSLSTSSGVTITLGTATSTATIVPEAFRIYVQDSALGGARFVKRGVLGYINFINSNAVIDREFANSDLFTITSNRVLLSSNLEVGSNSFNDNLPMRQFTASPNGPRFWNRAVNGRLTVDGSTGFCFLDNIVQILINQSPPAGCTAIDLVVGPAPSTTSTVASTTSQVVVTMTNSGGSIFTTTSGGVATSLLTSTTTNGASSVSTTTATVPVDSSSIMVRTTTDGFGSTFTTTDTILVPGQSTVIITTANSLGSTFTFTTTGVISAPSQSTVVVTTTDGSGGIFTTTNTILISTRSTAVTNDGDSSSTITTTRDNSQSSITTDVFTATDSSGSIFLSTSTRPIGQSTSGIVITTTDARGSTLTFTTTPGPFQTSLTMAAVITTTDGSGSTFTTTSTGIVTQTLTANTFTTTNSLGSTLTIVTTEIFSSTSSATTTVIATTDGAGSATSTQVTGASSSSLTAVVVTTTDGSGSTFTTTTSLALAGSTSSALTTAIITTTNGSGSTFTTTSTGVVQVTSAPSITTDVVTTTDGAGSTFTTSVVQTMSTSSAALGSSTTTIVATTTNSVGSTLTTTFTTVVSNTITSSTTASSTSTLTSATTTAIPLCFNGQNVAPVFTLQIQAANLLNIDGVVAGQDGTSIRVGLNSPSASQFTFNQACNIVNVNTGDILVPGPGGATIRSPIDITTNALTPAVCSIDATRNIVCNNGNQFSVPLLSGSTPLLNLDSSIVEGVTGNLVRVRAQIGGTTASTTFTSSSTSTATPTCFTNNVAPVFNVAANVNNPLGLQTGQLVAQNNALSIDVSGAPGSSFTFDTLCRLVDIATQNVAALTSGGLQLVNPATNPTVSATCNLASGVLQCSDQSGSPLNFVASSLLGTLLPLNLGLNLPGTSVALQAVNGGTTSTTSSSVRATTTATSSITSTATPACFVNNVAPVFTILADVNSGILRTGQVVSTGTNLGLDLTGLLGTQFTFDALCRLVDTTSQNVAVTTANGLQLVNPLTNPTTPAVCRLVSGVLACTDAVGSPLNFAVSSLTGTLLPLNLGLNPAGTAVVLRAGNTVVTTTTITSAAAVSAITTASTTTVAAISSTTRITSTTSAVPTCFINGVAPVFSLTSTSNIANLNGLVAAQVSTLGTQTLSLGARSPLNTRFTFNRDCNLVSVLNGNIALPGLIGGITFVTPSNLLGRTPTQCTIGSGNLLQCNGQQFSVPPINVLNGSPISLGSTIINLGNAINLVATI